MKTYLFLLFALLFYSCTNTSEKEVTTSQVLPILIYEGDSVTVYSIQDSINIDTTDLFFHIDMWKKDLSHSINYIKIKEGKTTFKIPKNTAYIEGYFYNLANQVNSIKYTRYIYGKDNKPVMNAYQRSNSQNDLNKELLNHPTNLVAYANYLYNLRNSAYLGGISDTLVQETATKYLSTIETKTDLTKANDLYTLVLLYANSGQIKKSKQILIQLAQKFPNSNLYKKGKTALWFINESFQNNTNKEGQILHLKKHFFDSLETHFAQSYPYSPEGVSLSANMYEKREGFTPEQTVINSYYLLHNTNPTDINVMYCLVEMKLLSNELDSALILAEKYLVSIQNKMDIHYTPDAKLERHDINLLQAYDLLAKVSEQKGNLTTAISYMDNAYDNLQKAGKNVMFYNMILKGNRGDKARLQRKTQQPAAALKTYSELYQEIQDEAILDSIKVVFEEQDQVEDYKNYIENLQNQTGSIKEELKTVPEFSIKDTKGNLYTDKNLKGAVVVLNFWGVHCSPCVREIPVMNEFWEATQGHEIVYLAITRDNALATERFGRRQKEMFKFPVVATNQAFFDRFGVQLIPTQIIINPKGEIIYRQVGATQDATQNLKKVLEKELKIDNILIE